MDQIRKLGLYSPRLWIHFIENMKRTLSTASFTQKRSKVSPKDLDCDKKGGIPPGMLKPIFENYLNFFSSYEFDEAEDRVDIETKLFDSISEVCVENWKSFFLENYGEEMRDHSVPLNDVVAFMAGIIFEAFVIWTKREDVPWDCNIDSLHLKRIIKDSVTYLFSKSLTYEHLTTAFEVGTLIKGDEVSFEEYRSSIPKLVENFKLIDFKADASTLKKHMEKNMLACTQGKEAVFCSFFSLVFADFVTILKTMRKYLEDAKLLAESEDGNWGYLFEESLESWGVRYYYKNFSDSE